MPVTGALPHAWYDTPNIHLSTIMDIRRLCKDEKIAIKEQINLHHESKSGLLSNVAPNLFSDLAIFVLGNER